METVKEFRITVRQFLTKPNPKYPNREPMPMRTMFGHLTGESSNAVKVALRGKPEPSSLCLHCGRTITHPVSILYGIGPVCGKHFHLSPFETEAELDAAMEEIKKNLGEVIWEGWLPRGHIEMEATGEEIEPFGVATEEPKVEVKSGSLYDGLSYEQEKRVEEAKMFHLDNPSKAKPVEIWTDRKGIVKLVFGKNDGTNVCYKIERDGNILGKTGMPFAPKYSMKHKISYAEKVNERFVKVAEGSKETGSKIPKPPKVDEELVSALAKELNSLFA